MIYVRICILPICIPGTVPMAGGGLLSYHIVIAKLVGCSVLLFLDTVYTVSLHAFPQDLQ